MKKTKLLAVTSKTTELQKTKKHRRSQRKERMRHNYQAKML